MNLPDKKYDIVLMDPPWYYGNKTGMAAAEKHYRTMKDADLMALDVNSLLLGNWTTTRLRNATHGSLESTLSLHGVCLGKDNKGWCAVRS